MSSGASAADALLASLALDAIDRDAFVGHPGAGSGPLFGGIVTAQAVVAAYQTLEDRADARPLHSLHAYFLRPGRHDLPIRFVVDRVRDGRSFTTRSVVAEQDGDALVHLAASFATPEDGIAHQEPMPDAPPPDGLPDWEEIRTHEAEHDGFVGDSAFEMRPCDPYDYDDPNHRAAPRQRSWMRVKDDLPDDPIVHTAMLVYLTDRTLLSTAAHTHGLTWNKRVSASLDHAVWIHRPPRLARDWILYCAESPVAHAARGLVYGSVYQSDGTHIASAAQEGLIRAR